MLGNARHNVLHEFIRYPNYSTKLHEWEAALELFANNKYKYCTGNIRSARAR